MDNVAVAQSVLGRDWENLSKDLLSERLQKKQSDDNLVTLWRRRIGQHDLSKR